MADQYVTEEDPRCVDPGFKVKLYPHQLAIASKMLYMEDQHRIKWIEGDQVRVLHTNLGFITDHIGSGKTLTTLCAIQAGKMTKMDKLIAKGSKAMLGPSGNERVYCYAEATIESTTNLVETTLIIIPKFLKKTVWIGEIAKTKLIAHEASEFHTYTVEELNKIDIVLCTSEVYPNFIRRHDYNWRRVIIDEMDEFSIRSMDEPMTNFIWLISNTIEPIFENRVHGGFYSRFRGFPVNILRRLELKSSPTFYSASVKLMSIEMVKVNYAGLPVLAYLRGTVTRNNENYLEKDRPDVVLRNIRASDFAGEIRHDNIVLEVRDYLRNGIANKFGALQAEAQAQMERLIENCRNVGTYVCFGCDDKFTTDPVLFGRCNHTVCMQCARISLSKHRCAVCDKNVETLSTAYFVDGVPTVYDLPVDDAPVEDGLKIVEPRLKYIQSLLEDPVGYTILTFSSPASQKLIYKYLKEKQYTPRMLTPGRTDCLDKLEKRDINVVCANGHTITHGLNIPYVDIIVIYDNLSQENFKQAIGRGQRIGRKHNLKVYTLADEEAIT